MRFNILPILTLATSISAMATHHHQNQNPPKPISMNPTANQTSLFGHAIVANNCPRPIYLWSVGESISDQITLHRHENYTETYRRDAKTGGIAIKITTVRDGLYVSAPQTVFAYNLVDEVVWYDLSDVFGDPFVGESVTLVPALPAIDWQEGVPPRGSQVRMQEARRDLVLTVC